MPRRLTTLYPILAFIAAIVIGPAARAADSESIVDVKTKLRIETTNLGRQDYQQSGEGIHSITRGNAQRVPLQLQGGVENIIVAVCDRNCDRIAVSLYDYQHNLVTQGPESQAVVIINGVPPYSGYHEVEIAVPGCKLSECTIGLLVLHQPPVAAPSPAPTAAEAHEPLPSEVPVDAEILRLVETHPFFAGAPPISVAAYKVQSTIKWTTRGPGVANTGGGSYHKHATLKGLRPGLAMVEAREPYTVNISGMTQRYNGTHLSVDAANGLFTLSYKYVNANTTTTSAVSAVDNLSGQIFPVALGRRFSYTITIRSKTLQSGRVINTGKSVTQNACEVTKSYEAKSFHPDLAGSAFLLTCSYRVLGDGQSKESRESKEIFVEHLGVWMKIDPMSPKERIISNGEVTLSGQYKTISDGTYKLESFALAR